MIQYTSSQYQIMDSNSIIKIVSPPLTFFPIVMITNNKPLSYLWTWSWLFGLLLNNLPSITATDVKQVFTMMYLFGVFYFAINVYFTWWYQYEIYCISSIDFHKNVLFHELNQSTIFISIFHPPLFQQNSQ